MGLVKRAGLPSPQRRKLREDAGGDDLRAGNYRFSGVFGGGPEHGLEAPVWQGDQDLRRASAIDDLVAHALWKAVHPFVRHQGDYRTPQDGEGELPVLAPLDFAALESRAAVPPPLPHSLRVDHRHRDVDYYANEAGLLILEDGTLLLFDGFGSTMVMTGGHIYRSAPGDLVDAATIIEQAIAAAPARRQARLPPAEPLLLCRGTF